MECAQCHDHKYDPFSQKNYYELYAFFNNTPEKGLEGLVGSKPAKTPIMYITDEDVQGVLDFVNKTDTGRMMVSVMDALDSLRRSEEPTSELQSLMRHSYAVLCLNTTHMSIY